MNESTALVPVPVRSVNRDSRALEPCSFGEAFDAARLLHKSNLFPESCRTPESAFAILAKGRELGLPMMQAMTEISMVKGKVQLSASLMAGLILNSGAAEYFSCIETSAERATYKTLRRGDPTGPKVLTYTMEEARAAGLVRKGERGLSAWEAHPADMLRARATSKLARMVYPDILTGCYTPDEMRDFDRSAEAAPPAERPAEVVQAQVVGEPAATKPAQLPPADDVLTPWLQRIEASQTPDELDTVRAEMNNVLKKRTKAQGEVLRKAMEATAAALKAREQAPASDVPSEEELAAAQEMARELNASGHRPGRPMGGGDGD